MSSSGSFSSATLPVDTEPVWPRNPRAYMALAGGFFCMFNSWGLVNAYGTFASYYQEQLITGTDVLLLNLVGSTESFVVLIFSFIVGRLLDAGYYKWLTGCGSALVALGTFTLSQTTKKEMTATGERETASYALIWVTQGLTTGLGMACLFVASSQIAATWFKKRKSFAIGIVACGASIAGVVYPVAVRYLIRIIGWEKAVLCVGGIVAFTGILTFILARPNPEQQLRVPEKWLTTKVWVDTNAFRHAAYVWFVASISLMFFGFYAVFFNLEEWSVAAGVGHKDTPPGEPEEPNTGTMRTFILLCIMNGASSMGRLSSAYLSDHFGAVRVHAIVSFVASILVLALWTVTNKVAEAIAFVILFGAVSGAVIGLPPASVANILGLEPSRQAKLGQWTGVMYTCAAPFALTGPVIAGHLIQKYDTYLTVQLWSGVCLFLSACCQAIAFYYMRRERKLEQTTMGINPSAANTGIFASGATTRQASRDNLTDLEAGGSDDNVREKEKETRKE